MYVLFSKHFPYFLVSYADWCLTRDHKITCKELEMRLVALYRLEEKEERHTGNRCFCGQSTVREGRTADAVNKIIEISWNIWEQ